MLSCSYSPVVFDRFKVTHTVDFAWIESATSHLGHYSRNSFQWTCFDTSYISTRPPMTHHSSNALLQAMHKYKVDTCHCPSLTLALWALNAHMHHAQPPHIRMHSSPFVRAARLGGSFPAVAGTMTKLQGIFLCTNISNKMNCNQ